MFKESTNAFASLEIWGGEGFEAGDDEGGVSISNSGCVSRKRSSRVRKPPEVWRWPVRGVEWFAEWGAVGRRLLERATAVERERLDILRADVFRFSEPLLEAMMFEDVFTWSRDSRGPVELRCFVVVVWRG